ncbi:pyrroline-5-carboxylate reductase [Bordetella genomosp. 9]|uniref:Pyrroline-5-carboxylate reductase n=1 Tax=Bordetella genomosp. 9 TaxID=1416803 RepID=A0A1W6Z065_9BORD|nr:pyrroline-5-carboxylate reductase [Bordetella genomosp. 9]ARP86509.1 pyrroline-5-carboxylate reductase [Bordetella genomosp. 9]ARP90524.1 pyrroline-5-carboxylate reductase [Bordetella genomosp. 9]
MDTNLRIAFIGGGNMASALGAGMADKIAPAGNFHVIDINRDAHAGWLQRGASAATAADDRLAGCNVWFYAVKPQFMHDAVRATQPFLRDGTLVISVAAGIRGDVLAAWLGGDKGPWPKLVRCMPNTPALVGEGVTGMFALPGVAQAERDLAQAMLASVGKVVWVENDAAIDAVTALSGSGPAYVFRFIEALIEGGMKVGLDAAQARELALGTLSGATRLARESDDPPAVLRERVTSRGGTTAAALKVLEDGHFMELIAHAMQAAAHRSRELSDEFGQV